MRPKISHIRLKIVLFSLLQFVLLAESLIILFLFFSIEIDKLYLLSLAVGIAVLVIAWVWSKSLLKPLNSTIQILNKISQEEKLSRLDQYTITELSDDLYSEMAESIKKLVEKKRKDYRGIIESDDEDSYGDIIFSDSDKDQTIDNFKDDREKAFSSPEDSNEYKYINRQPDYLGEPVTVETLPLEADDDSVEELVAIHDFGRPLERVSSPRKTEALSQDEINLLLSSISTGDIDSDNDANKSDVSEEHNKPEGINKAADPGFPVSLDDERDLYEIKTLEINDLKLVIKGIFGIDNTLIIFMKGQMYHNDYISFEEQIKKLIESGFHNLIFHMEEFAFGAYPRLDIFSSIAQLVKPNGGEVFMTGLPEQLFDTLDLLGESFDFKKFSNLNHATLLILERQGKL